MIAIIRSVIGVTWTDREGLKAERSQYFIGQNAGPDTRQTFDQAGLIVFTDAYVVQSPNSGNKPPRAKHSNYNSKNWENKII